MWIVFLVVFFSVCTMPAAAEVRSYAEVFGAYSLLNGDLFQHGSGWEFALTKNLMLDRGKPWLGIQADFSAHHQSNGLVQRNEHSFLFGPQFEHTFDHLTLTAHALAGLSHTSGSLGTTNSPAFGIGGGVDWRLGPVFAIRIPQIDYEPLRLNGSYQHNMRISAGVVLSVPAFFDRAPPPPPRNVPPAAKTSSSSR